MQVIQSPDQINGQLALNTFQSCQRTASKIIFLQHTKCCHYYCHLFTSSLSRGQPHMSQKDVGSKPKKTSRIIVVSEVHPDLNVHKNPARYFSRAIIHTHLLHSGNMPMDIIVIYDVLNFNCYAVNTALKIPNPLLFLVCNLSVKNPDQVRLNANRKKVITALQSNGLLHKMCTHGIGIGNGNIPYLKPRHEVETFQCIPRLSQYSSDSFVL